MHWIHISRLFSKQSWTMQWIAKPFYFTVACCVHYEKQCTFSKQNSNGTRRIWTWGIHEPGKGKESNHTWKPNVDDEHQTILAHSPGYIFAMPCYPMLCDALLFAILCLLLLCPVMLGLAELCPAVPWHTWLGYALLCFAKLCRVMLGEAWHCFAMHCYASPCYVLLCFQLLVPGYASLCFASLWPLFA